MATNICWYLTIPPEKKRTTALFSSNYKIQVFLLITQVDFGVVYTIVKVQTQGRNGGAVCYVTGYNILIGLDCGNLQIVNGTDGQTAVSFIILSYADFLISILSIRTS